MSFLAPLYFLAGLAIAGPIVLHLIRRQPKSEVEFSSLMFLDATPPRLTRRSRLENLPLLLLRCAAILMLAFAFARPFLPIPQSDTVEGVKQAVVVLVDQSASMKRSGLWDQAIEKANQVLDSVDDETLVSVIGFDTTSHPSLTLEESAGLTSATRKGAAKDALAELSPTWAATDLGNAIRFAADQAAMLELGAKTDGDQPIADSAVAAATLQTRIVLLSDLQQGAAIETLQGYQWPDRVWLDVETLRPSTRGNATLRVMPSATANRTDEIDSPGRAATGKSESVRVQVSQSDDGEQSTFRLAVQGSEDNAKVVQVPPGQTRFFDLTLPPISDTSESATQAVVVRLTGDQDDFDNDGYLIRAKRNQQTVLFFEPKSASAKPDQDVRETLSFYAKQVPWSDSTRTVTLDSVNLDTVNSGVPDGAALSKTISPAATPLLICSRPPSDPDAIGRLKDFLKSGGRVLVVLDQMPEPDSIATLADWLDSPQLAVTQSDQADYALIAGVNFQSPLIAPLAEPGVNDFSSIRIWQHREIAGLSDDVETVLKLDNGAPLLVSKTFPAADIQQPAGKLWVLSAGWQPEQSQFALSTKFVPILLGMLGKNRLVAPDSLQIGDPIEADTFASEPGIQTLSDGSKIAVNLNLDESDTGPSDLDRLAQYGAVVSSPASREQDKTAMRALRDVELESKQGWWQWLILATLGLIAAETFWAGRDRPLSQGNENE
ncbi:BatA domain-containing protein [Stieleria sp. TO1_6]|uniref:BatA domain-containing protein n=1 Tax=Stieleria tagensis TaxID=2956795 RepID=UPI00209B0655|nr:BatA domain-containing protein [Stieleria tagensis]MCO8125359.1 BatA domain-containing protein [Stieleria tagensis]